MKHIIFLISTLILIAFSSCEEPAMPDTGTEVVAQAKISSVFDLDRNHGYTGCVQTRGICFDDIITGPEPLLLNQMAVDVSIEGDEIVVTTSAINFDENTYGLFFNEGVFVFEEDWVIPNELLAPLFLYNDIEAPTEDLLVKTGTYHGEVFDLDDSKAFVCTLPLVIVADIIIKRVRIEIEDEEE